MGVAKTLHADQIRYDGHISVKTYGATGDGVTDDRAAIQAAFTAAAAQIAAGLSGCEVYFPPGIYMVSRSGGSSFCLDLGASNITLKGVKYLSWIKQVAGLPATSIAALRVDNQTNFKADGLGFDGNWGNAVTTIANASNAATLPTGTINVKSTTGFAASGTFTIVLPTGPQVITYTGVTATSFTGCTGGAGTLVTGQTVGYIDANTGINQTTQADPKNYLLMLRGVANPEVKDCLFKQCYGDCIWMGGASADNTVWTTNARVLGCDMDMSARNGITLGGPTSEVNVQSTNLTNIFSQTIDTEAPDQPATDVTLNKCLIGAWWNPTTTTPAPISVVGGNRSLAAQATKYRITDCTIYGTTLIERATDIVFANNRVIQDYAGTGKAGVYISISSQDVSIHDNYFYTRLTATSVANGGSAAIVLLYNASGTVNFQPTNVQIYRNRIKARNGRDGIAIIGPGGNQTTFLGTSDATTNLTIKQTGAGWTVNQWSGFFVQTGNVIGAVDTNTADTITLINAHASFTGGWTTFLGADAATPAVGAFTIYAPTGEVVVDDNQIDCSNDGFGNGRYGVYTATDVIGAAVLGARIRVSRNQIKNATDEAIHIAFAGAQSPYTSLELSDNKAYDTQSTPTCTNCIKFDSPQFITKLILRGNQSGDGVAGNVTGLTSGTWLVNDGYPQMWAGWGSPNNVITADIGATFQRLDSGGARGFWVKQSDAGLSTGWVGLTKPPSVAWTVDGGSGIGIPQNSTEWAAVIAAAGLTGLVSVPDALWLCQETAGNLADSIGAFPLTAAGAGITYQQTVSGWESRAVKTVDNSNSGFTSTDAALPDLSVANATMCGYIIIDSNSNINRQIIGLGTGAGTRAWIGGSTATRVVSGPNTTTATGTQYQTVRPYGIQYNRTGVSTIGFEDHDKLTPAFSAAVTGKSIGLGYNGVTAAPLARYLYAWAWLTTTPTLAQIKAIYGVLGWLVDWT